MFKFLHAADIHLDSPLRSLGKYPGAPVEKIRLATREALTNLVNLALEEAVAFVVIAGDVYDGDWDDYNTGHFFNAQMVRLAQANIPVSLLCGNHDAQNKMTRTLTLPANVSVFSTSAPETFHLENVPVSLHGQGFASQSIKQDLSLAYPKADAGQFNIGVLHTCVDGREGHADYAPCTITGLLAKGYDYWALGHIHQREILRERDPMIAFSGNIQGRHIREPGPRGCLIVEVDDKNQIARHRFQPLDCFRWEVCEVDLSEAEEDEEILDSVTAALRENLETSEGRPTAVRVVLAGACPLHDSLLARQSFWTAQIQAAASQVSGDRLWIERVQFKMTPIATGRELADLDGPIAELSACLRQWAASDEKLQGLITGFNDLRRHIPAELLDSEDGVRLDSPNWLQAKIEDAEKLAIGRLISQEVAP